MLIGNGVFFQDNVDKPEIHHRIPCARANTLTHTNAKTSYISAVVFHSWKIVGYTIYSWNSSLHYTLTSRKAMLKYVYRLKTLWSKTNKYSTSVFSPSCHLHLNLATRHLRVNGRHKLLFQSRFIYLHINMLLVRLLSQKSCYYK